MTIEFWTTGHALPLTVAERGQRLEAEGWDGMGVADSQNLNGDAYVGLALAAKVTTSLKLATAVTNSATRHPAVAASAAATVQAESGGRFVLGIGRGDSALAHIGLAPAPLAQFEHYLERLQGYLRREEVPFDLNTDAVSGLRSSDSLGFSDGPKNSRLRWLRDKNPKVPVHVAASGPKVIELAASVADGITFAVGVEPGRLKWAIDLARAARAASPLAADDLTLGTYVPVLVHEDLATAREMVSGSIGSYARFSVMHGKVAGPVAGNQKETLEAVHDAYDMNAHFKQGSAQSKALTTEVIDAFAIAGPISYCIERLEQLRELGLTRLVLNAPARGLDEVEAAAAHRRLVERVLPNVSRD